MRTKAAAARLLRLATSPAAMRPKPLQAIRPEYWQKRLLFCGSYITTVKNIKQFCSSSIISSPWPRGSSVFGANHTNPSCHFCRFQSNGPDAGTVESRQMQKFTCIIAELVENGTVGLITLNRPEVFNALSQTLMHEVIDALKMFDSEPDVGAIVITGKGKAFAAGADIKEMKDKSLADVHKTQFISKWNDVATIRKPIIAAVNGYALGGGCELAMSCDIILVGDKAVFGQPEVNLGTIPGMGGTQRLIRVIGKSRAMEMILSGQNFIDADEAVQRGLASRLIQGTDGELLKETLKLAKRISELSQPMIAMAKAAINAAYETGLKEGISKEQALFFTTFGFEDREEGMTAFLEKRKPNFQHK